MLGRVGIGAGEREDVVGEVPGRRPDLLAVEDPLVAVELRLEGEAAEVGAGVGLRVALAPRVLAGQDARQVVLLLLLGAPHQQRVAEHLDAEAVVGAAHRHAGLGELLGEDDLLERGQPGTAVLHRPAGREVAGLVERRAPRRHEVAHLVVRQLADAPPVRRQLLGEERLDLVAVCLGLGPYVGFTTSIVLKGAGAPGPAPARRVRA